MHPDRWRQIEQLCHDALAREPGERSAFLDSASAGDADLRREVESLLAQQSAAGGFLERRVAAVRAEPVEARTTGPLTPGTRLGPYEITTAIGAGGMGEVYKACDTRLGRTVAVKVLPSGLASDPERRRRFEHEARAVSALNHPNICTLHDIGSDRGIDFLVMELLEGQTLAERLRKGPLPLEQALEYGAQIADALGKAHRQGILHRDLKPANIMLTKSGAKLLDFGLAKLKTRSATSATARLSAVGTQEPTTTPGLVIGTVPYMAPEQLEGKETDARTDLFAFGCVLYEMLTGRRAFPGESEASVISAIMSSQPPPVSSLQPVTPPLLDHIVRTCLEKEPDERWQSAADITRGLRWVAERQRLAGHANSGEAPHRAAAGPLGRTRRLVRVAALGTAVLLILAAGAALTWFVTRNSNRQQRPVERFLIDTRPADGLRGPDSAERTLGLNRPGLTAVAISPDGTWLVFSATQGGRQQLYRRRLSEDAAVPLADTEGAENPFFSPDGNWIGFWARGAVWKMRLEGGVPTRLCPVRGGIVGASWGSRDVIAFASTNLYVVSAAGGAPKVVVTPNAAREETEVRFPHFLPDRNVLLLTIVRDQLDLRTASVVAVSLPSAARTPLVEGAVDARYLRSGHLAYARLGTLEAVPFDANGLAITGQPAGLVNNLMQAVNAASSVLDTGAAQFSVSAAGTLVYLAGGMLPDRQNSLVWVDRRGAVVETLPLAPAWYGQPRISPEARRLLFITSGLRESLWSYDIASRTSTLLTGRGHPYAPIWTPDGRRAVFTALNRMSSISVDGRSTPTQLGGQVPSAAIEAPGCWTPDGNTLVYTRLGEEIGGPAIWQFRIENGVPTRAVLLPGERVAPVPILYNLPALSPDGRWLAYASTESGQWQVYVERFPELGDRRQPYHGPARSPVWRRDGRELFFVAEQTGHAAEGAPRRMMAIDVRPDGRFAGEPRVLFEIPADLHTAVGSVAPYDVRPDGRQFIFVRRQSATVPPPPSQMHVVLNWFEELKAKVPAR